MLHVRAGFAARRPAVAWGSTIEVYAAAAEMERRAEKRILGTALLIGNGAYQMWLEWNYARSTLWRFRGIS